MAAFVARALVGWAGNCVCAARRAGAPRRSLPPLAQVLYHRAFTQHIRHLASLTRTIITPGFLVLCNLHRLLMPIYPKDYG